MNQPLQADPLPPECPSDPPGTPGLAETEDPRSMEIQRALDHISHIRDHLERTQVYRGIRSATLALSGLLALAAALIQPAVLGTVAKPRAFIGFWVAIAVLSLLLGGGTILWNYVMRATESERRITRQVVGQFVPAVAAGAIVTAALAMSPAEFAPILPGLWSILFGLAVFSSRPLLPRSIGWVALYYVLAGGVLLKAGSEGWSLSPWAMGLTFAPGQFAAAVILFWNLERRKHG